MIVGDWVDEGEEEDIVFAPGSSQPPLDADTPELVLASLGIMMSHILV